VQCRLAAVAAAEEKQSAASLSPLPRLGRGWLHLLLQAVLLAWLAGHCRLEEQCCLFAAAVPARC
jgi:hypothetical protein